MKKPKTKRYYFNNQIRAKEVRLIDETGKNLGIKPFSEALKMAYNKRLDLVQITEKVSPPVVRMVDYGKFLYQQKKEAKKLQKKEEMKAVRLGFREGEHDLGTKAKKIDIFLKNDYKVRIDLYLRGREKKFSDLAKEKLENFLKKISSEYRIIQEPKKVPRGFSVVISKKQS